MKTRIAWLITGMSLGLLALGALRLSGTHSTAPPALAKLVTPGYIGLVVLFTIALARAGLPLNRVGFGSRLSGRHILFGLAAVALLRVFAITIHPILEAALGGPRDLGRFSDVQGSMGSMIALLAASWTISAFGEEIAYRIVLMRGIAYALGDTRRGTIAAVAIQAVLFGLIHAYQGPTGVAGSAVNGLVFGAAALAGRWSIWPSAIAHGVNNTIGILSLYQG